MEEESIFANIETRENLSIASVYGDRNTINVYLGEPAPKKVAKEEYVQEHRCHYEVEALENGEQGYCWNSCDYCSTQGGKYSKNGLLFRNPILSIFAIITVVPLFLPSSYEIGGRLIEEVVEEEIEEIEEVEVVEVVRETKFLTYSEEESIQTEADLEHERLIAQLMQMKEANRLLREEAEEAELNTPFWDKKENAHLRRA